MRLAVAIVALAIAATPGRAAPGDAAALKTRIGMLEARVAALEGANAASIRESRPMAPVEALAERAMGRLYTLIRELKRERVGYRP